MRQFRSAQLDSRSTKLVDLLYGSAHSPQSKKTIYQQVLKLGANEASAQGFQNAIQNDRHIKFLTELWEFENRQVYMGTVWSQVVQQNPIQIIYRHIPI